MKKSLWSSLFLVLCLSLITGFASAQVTNRPIAHRLQNFTYHAQWWNNCGPATLTTALSHFGYTDDQGRAQNFLKPNIEDKNVNPTELVDFVNTQVGEIPIYALLRVGGNIELLKTLLANDFPLMIEAGYDPPPHNLGWMGHYLLVVGYDDSVGVFTTHDSYDGESLNYTYGHVQEFWQHFNYPYIVLFRQERLNELLTLLGEDPATFDPTTGYYQSEKNSIEALNLAVAEASVNNNDAWAWFNIGTNYVRLAELNASRGEAATSTDFYNRAVLAYDRARNIGLPWRMMWYQFGAYEAYYHVGRYDDMLQLAHASMNDGGGQLVEETLYYGALAREALGEYQRAINNYNGALQINPNHRLSLEARDALQSRMNG